MGSAKAPKVAANPKWTFAYLDLNNLNHTGIDEDFVHVLFIPYSRIVFVGVMVFERNVLFNIHTQMIKKILRMDGDQKCKMSILKVKLAFTIR